MTEPVVLSLASLEFQKLGTFFRLHFPRTQTEDAFQLIRCRAGPLLYLEVFALPSTCKKNYACVLALLNLATQRKSRSRRSGPTIVRIADVGRVFATIVSVR